MMQDHRTVSDEFQRRLSGLERAPLRMPNANVIAVAQIAGALEKADLDRAVAKVRQRHPWLRARVRLAEKGEAWFVSDGAPAIPVRVERGANGWQDGVVQELQRPFAIEKGPLIRFRLLQAPERAHLIMVAHHAITDGMSMVWLARDLASALAAPTRPVQRLPVPPPIDAQSIPQTARGGWFSSLLLGLIGRKWLKKGIAFDETDFVQLCHVFWQRHQNRVLAWRLSEAQTSALVSRCRDERVSVNTALVTAFVAAQHDVTRDRDGHPRDVVVSVDLRDRLRVRPGEAFGFYAASVRPDLRWEGGTPFWDAARTFHAQIGSLLTDRNMFASQRVQDLPGSLLDALPFASYGLLDDPLALKLLARTKKGEVSMGLLIANLGKLDGRMTGTAGRLEALYGPFVYSDNAEKYLGALTLNGRLHLSLSYGETILGAEQAIAQRDRAMEILAGATG